MHDEEQSPELNEMLEVAEGVNISVCGSVYPHDCVIDFNCEVATPSNSDTLRDHQIHQIGHA